MEAYSLDLGFGGLAILQVLSISLEGADDVQRRTVTASSRLDGSSVDHKSRSVESTKSLSR